MSTAKRVLSITLCAVILALMCAFPVSVAIASGSPAVMPAVTGEEQSAEIIKILSTYSPTMMRMLESEFVRREGTTYRFGSTVNGVTTWSEREFRTIDDLILPWHHDGGDLITALDTAVHENYHGFQFSDRVIRSGVRRIIHIINGETVFIPTPLNQDNIINTDRATSGIPVDLRTFRWES